MDESKIYSVRFQGSTGVVDAQVGACERILLAGLSRGINLPYECASGTCGECRAKLLSGSVKPLWSSAPAASKLRSDEILTCQSCPRSDLVLKHAGNIEVSHWQTDRSRPNFQRGTFTSVELVDSNTAIVRASLPKPIVYSGGQFVLIGIPGIDGYRAYSFADYMSPSCDIKLLIRRKDPGGISSWLFRSDRRNIENEKIDVFGPLGKAYYKGADADGDLILIMGGSGIAVGMSVIEHAFATRHFSDRRGSLFFGVRTPEEAFFGRELESYVAASKGRLSATVAFSEGAAGQSLIQAHPLLQFTTGFVHEAACVAIGKSCSEATAFVAGPSPMVDAAIRGLIVKAGFAPHNIRYDKFA